jgi:hypothetical protein
MGKFAAFFLALFLRIIACPNKFALFFLDWLLCWVCDLLRFTVFFQPAPPHAPGPPRLPRPKLGGPFSKVRDQQSSSSNYGFLFRPLCKFCCAKTAKKLIKATVFAQQNMQSCG